MTDSPERLALDARLARMLADALLADLKAELRPDAPGSGDQQNIKVEEQKDAA